MEGKIETGSYLPEDPRKRKEEGQRPGGGSLVHLGQSEGPESLRPVSKGPSGRKGGPTPDLVGGSAVLDFILHGESTEQFQAGEGPSLTDRIRKTADCWWRPELWEQVKGWCTEQRLVRSVVTVTRCLDQPTLVDKGDSKFRPPSPTVYRPLLYLNQSPVTSHPTWPPLRSLRPPLPLPLCSSRCPKVED